MIPLKIEDGDPVRRVPRIAWIWGLALTAVLLWIFRVPIGWMIDRWVAKESYYSHGFFVPFVSLFFVWRDRRNLAALSTGRSWLGLAVFLLGLLVFLLSGILSVFFTAAFGLILVVWGAAGFIFGRRVMLRLWFPMFLLLFMVPLPLAMIAEISLKMKLLATQLALVLLDAVNILAINDGSTIYLENEAVVTVGNACSGLRSLISLVFLGVLFAYMSDLTPPRKGLLFLASMPIAIAANIVRVFGLCLIAAHWGSEAISGTIHDASGYLIFVVAFALLYGTNQLLRIGLGNRGGGGQPPTAQADAGEGPATATTPPLAAEPARPLASTALGASSKREA